MPGSFESFIPEAVALDFETADGNGASLEYWRPDFRAMSAAFSWFGRNGELSHSFWQSEESIREQLRVIERLRIPLIAHNAQFEYGVLHCRFPEFDRSLLKYDTMRMVQNEDSGGSRARLNGPRGDELSIEDELRFLEGKDETDNTGLGLGVSAKRHLPKDWHNHKDPFYKILREQHGVRKGKEGENLHLLTASQLEAYNTADTDVALLLFQTLRNKFSQRKFNWIFDHFLHFGAIRRIVEAKVLGIPVDRELLDQFIQSTEIEMLKIKSEFRNKLELEIESMESERRQAWVSQPKTDRGRAQREEKVWEKADEWTFNPGSTTQLRQLFVDRMKMPVKFWTKESKQSKEKRKKNPDLPPYEPNPSFKASHLPTYGEGGEILATLKKRQVVSRQAKNLYLLSEFDGRWHFDLRACGTKTGRYTGGSGGAVKLNIQALSRREKGLMQCLLPEPGHVMISIDLSAGEPSVIAHYSQDENYIATAFGMVGKDPYWKDDLLLIDDPYLSFASVSPLGAAEIRKAWDDGVFAKWVSGGKEYQEYVQKSLLKKLRAFHKTLFLALVYGQSPQGMVNFAADNGYLLNKSTAKEVWNAFWFTLFPRVRRLGDMLSKQFERDGCLINAFGFRMVPEQARLALNYKIQSSVSGIMKVFEEKLFAAAPWAFYKGTIHDEVLASVPKDRLEEFREVASKATESLNKDLKWTINIRTGFVEGNNFYEAK